ncbi:hypothetical protein [Scytonema millei]|uniref:Uncharacterized protein n=1 Tax=Scytonema millei VB511283 TaxID=1245923 RepID=A0A9X5EA42_9CYAN|nr:hypothetical protein [Scytonema millei]NHC36889.1 hypothetical protein [Scytonema millei VB511283]
MATLARGVKLSELTATSAQDRERQVKRLFQDALTPTEEQIKKQSEEINAKIRDFERRYEMPSVVMRQNLLEGKIKETADICSWLILLKLRNRLDAYRNKTSTQ